MEFIVCVCNKKAQTPLPSLQSNHWSLNLSGVYNDWQGLEVEKVSTVYQHLLSEKTV